jgi:hypothetical protein
MDNNTITAGPLNFYSSESFQPVAEPVSFLSTLSYEDLLIYVRGQRNTLLEESDWTQLPDVPLTEDLKQQYRVYRQALRDITRVLNSYQDLVWPVKPE